MSRTPALLVAALATCACLTTACSGSAKTVHSTVTATVTSPGPTVTTTVTATPTPSAAPAAGYRVGQVYTTPDGVAKVGVVAYTAHGVGDTGTAGTHYRDLKVKVCAGNAPISVSAGPWSLIGADSSNNSDIVNGGGLHEPQYPVGDDLAVGECVTGWISFQVPDSVKIVSAKYNPQGNGGDPEIARWKLA